MNKHPIKRKARPARTVEGDFIDLSPAGGRKDTRTPLPVPEARKNAGFRFRYSYAEFSSIGDSAQFKTKHLRYEEGKLTAESFEGKLDPSSDAHLLNEVQRFFAALYLQAFEAFLPPFRRNGGRQ